MIPCTLMKAFFIMLVCLFIFNKKVNGQDKPPITFGKILPADFDLTSNNIVDSNTNGVIICDVGSIDFVGNKTNNWISYVSTKTTRIKIINKKAYDKATIEIELYGTGNRLDKLDNLQATTYNLVNGKVIEKKLLPADIFENRANKNRVEKKFTMPDVKEGSIIEYTYTITSRRFNDLPSWEFQDNDLPCLYSQLKITIPDLLRFLTAKHGVDTFDVNKSVDTYGTLQMATVNVGTSMHTHTYVMKNIAPLKPEKFVDAPSDYVDRLEFHLTQTYNGQDVDDLMTDWKSANNQLMKTKDFGFAISEDNATNLLNTTNKICDNTTNPLDASRAIYYYMRDNFTCVPNNSIYLYHDPYEINQTKKGSVAEINLLLVALLRQKGLKADPIILSTRDYGMHPTNYPVLEKMNYIICMLKLYGDTIYLDASHAQLGFGKLPLSCYNGHGEIINSDGGGSVFLYPDAISEFRSTSVFLYSSDKGDSITGSLQFNPGYFESYNIRNTINEKSEKEYLNSIKYNYEPDYEINNTTIDSLKKLEMPIALNYDLAFKISNGEDLILFSPILNNGYRDNPFRSEDRKLPIQMQYPLDDIYVLNMEIPKGYKVDEMPASAKIAFNGKEGLFEYLISKDDSNIRLRCRIQLKHCLFYADDNKTLRDFYAYIIKKYSEQIVFKKIR